LGRQQNFPQTAAEALYTDIDNLELHVSPLFLSPGFYFESHSQAGLQAEETKRPGPGAGLCPGYTISRAILADAVCLTRGDRFLTVNFTRKPDIWLKIGVALTCRMLAFSLTSWGYQDCQFDKNDGSFGGMLTKLLFRTLPDYYPAGSAYAHFPFLVPGYIKEHLAKLPNSPVGGYTWSRPPLPRGPITASSYQVVGMILVDEKTFQSGYDKKIYNVTNGAILYKRIVRQPFPKSPLWD
jgi:linoleate 10R-lipoxygenase